MSEHTNRCGRRISVRVCCGGGEEGIFSPKQAWLYRWQWTKRQMWTLMQSGPPIQCWQVLDTPPAPTQKHLLSWLLKGKIARRQHRRLVLSATQHSPFPWGHLSGERVNGASLCFKHPLLYYDRTKKRSYLRPPNCSCWGEKMQITKARTKPLDGSDRFTTLGPNMIITEMKYFPFIIPNFSFDTKWNRKCINMFWLRVSKKHVVLNFPGIFHVVAVFVNYFSQLTLTFHMWT